MNWTFGIITGGGQESNINRIIESIQSQNIPKYEIIIVGDYKGAYKNQANCVAFDESKKHKWITKKKNMITNLSKFDKILYMHDYVLLESGWYEGFEKFGYDWDVCMTKIKNGNGNRFRDWVLWPPKFVNYKDTSQTKDMYVSGTYFCADKKFMTKFKFDERLSWGQGEDVDWSCKARKVWDYKCNYFSEVQLMKTKIDHTRDEKA